jgi:hypothetical protein
VTRILLSTPCTIRIIRLNAEHENAQRHRQLLVTVGLLTG